MNKETKMWCWTLTSGIFGGMTFITPHIVLGVTTLVLALLIGGITLAIATENEQ